MFVYAGRPSCDSKVLVACNGRLQGFIDAALSFDPEAATFMEYQFAYIVNHVSQSVARQAVGTMFGAVGI